MKNFRLWILFIGVVWTLSNCSNVKKQPLVTYQKWHTITLSFDGPEASEDSVDNPFLNYRLVVKFTHQDGTEYQIRGFYAADGNAAETSASAGNIWQARFTPDELGEWKYTAMLHYGDSIALSDNYAKGERINIKDSIGGFVVVTGDKTGVDFRAHGRLGVDNGYFRFQESGNYWIKGGTDSPENLLAYSDFDGTYRTKAEVRFGEASAGNNIHSYEPHLKDWKPGDPSWQNGKGKSLIGAINYLSSKGMNVAYFLVMNILGDGKDVWPYTDPEDFTRFDVSKLDQWEIVFQHMQAKGIMLHVVLQETENETMLDNGDTGPLRQLYLRELIARFGHHLALKWNLGEENGPASFTPIAQNDQQRKAMTSFIKQVDPYNHVVLLHTHAHDPERSDILNQIIGYKELDGLSLQVDKRKGAAGIVETWKNNAHNSGHDWMITMDEIGMWHTGALPDSLDGNHDTLRRYVLWGTLMSGAAGVEWYFGAKDLHNDLTSEDWRRRDRLWELTNHALVFFQNHLPYWQMQPDHDLVNSDDAYCFNKIGEVYAIYLPDNSKEYTLDLNSVNGKFSVQWFNPLMGGELKVGSEKILSGGGVRAIGTSPTGSYPDNQDWVVLIKKK